MRGATKYLSDPRWTFPAAVLLRVGLIAFGTFQDRYSPVKYTDIDYYVFTDAARYVARGQSPYSRDTYRYTPLLAWALLPTTWSGSWFHFGKVLFAACDVLGGWLIMRILETSHHMSRARAVKYANLWLLNPMVAQISTRGSSEGLLLVIILSTLWALSIGKHALAGLLLGVSVHLKIYPFIYGVSMFWWLGTQTNVKKQSNGGMANPLLDSLLGLFSRSRMMILLVSLATFGALNVAMYLTYGTEFIQHTYLYHVVRSDHRHNFSPYNTLLYLNASPVSQSPISAERYAFLPQLILSVFILPLTLAQKSLEGTMLLQTITFVAFNKVCTSQYFLWYMVLLPFYLPGSIMFKNKSLGAAVLGAWIIGQAFWLQQGFRLEFLGISSFFPGLYLAAAVFFAINVWILGIIIADIRSSGQIESRKSAGKRE